MTGMLSVSKVAQMLGVSSRSVRRWASQGKVKAVRVGSQYRFHPQDVLAAMTVGTANSR